MSLNSGKTGRSETRTGFANTDIQRFILQGNTQGSSRGRNLNDPTKVARTTDTTDNKASPVGKLLGEKSGTTISETGFGGEFSDLSTEQVSGLVNVFRNRQSEIRSRLRQPGRSQLQTGR